MTMTERAFKVRSGKIIRKLKEMSVECDSPSFYAFGLRVDFIVKDYFPEEVDSNRFFKSEFFEPFYEAFVAKAREYFGGSALVEGKDKSVPLPKPVRISPKTGPRKKAVKKLVVSEVKVIDGPKGRRHMSPELKKAIKSARPLVGKSDAVVDSVSKSVGFDRADIVFSFDDTGSMSACRHTVRKMINELSAELLVEFGDKLNVGVMIHGDYCDPGDPCVSLPLSKDWVGIKRFLDESRRYHGGDAPECYELALKMAQDFDWRAKAQKILVLIGDDEPHETSYRLNKGAIDWVDETTKLADMGVQVVAVQALNRSWADYFYRRVAQLTGGYHLRLTQLNQIADLLRAICYNSCGELGVFESKLNRVSSGSSPAFKRNLDVLAGRESKVGLVEGLSEFQMFTVDKDVPIREFVTSMGLEFKKGCGYYEFMKPETVQTYKKVVVQDRATEVFYPDLAGRELLALPSSGNVRINPKSYDDQYRFFIQSTSYNRVLKKGTTFLYDDRSLVAI